VSSAARRHRLVRVASFSVCAIAIGYLVALVVRDIHSIRTGIAQVEPWHGLLAVFALMAAMTTFGLAAAFNVRMMGYRVPLASICYAFFLSQIGKYVPGRVWLYAIRGVLYSRYGIPIRVSALSMVIETALYVASALAVGLLLVPFEQFGLGVVDSTVVVVLLVGLGVSCSPPVLNWLLARWCRRSDAGTDKDDSVRVGYTYLGSILGTYALAWLGVGAAFLVLTRSVTPVSLNSYPQVTAAILAGCIAGYLVPLAPAGLGVRELVLTGALTVLFSPAIAALLALLARCWWTLSEFGCIGLALGVRWIASSRDR